ncbi:MAG: WecB/TagA/CpsF family glycosyltransferase [Lachnospiraceae bacterium]|nr:WecB/TagA/CpsF family glycosyltransferase [Lachnospiraceae bacterium]MBR2275617.1 WecB/TagA/CpsF family glycosyltransferase [Lachnospiraceae bacterium]
MITKTNILGTEFAVFSREGAAKAVYEGREALSGEYICFANVHVTVMAHDTTDYQRILNDSAYTFADGAPIARLQRKQGFAYAERVAGPDFITDLIGLCEPEVGGRNYSHFFYGSSEEVLSLLYSRLSERFPKLRIAGTYSPPYRELTAKEDQAVTDMIRKSGADFIWVGLGAPKQERWMAAHKGTFSGVMLGVGAGFDFHAGTVKRAPKSWQKLGLEWLYRLFSDPKRLFKRYLVTNTKFLWYTRGALGKQEKI